VGTTKAAKLWLLISSLARCATLLAADDLAVARSQYQLRGHFLAAATIRHEDGKGDLAILSMESSGNSRVRELFSLSEKRLKPQGSTIVWADAAAFDVCAIPGKAQAEQLIYFRPNGVYAEGVSKPLISSSTLFAHNRRSQLPRLRACHSLKMSDGSVAQTIVVPKLSDIELWKVVSGVYKKFAVLPYPARMSFYNSYGDDARVGSVLSIRANIEASDLVAADFNGDGFSDLCFTFQDEIQCHFQKKSGFTRDPSLSRSFDLYSIDEERQNNIRIQPRLIDLNGDGKLDVVIQKSNFALSEMRGEVNVFLQETDGTFAAKPAQTLFRDGFFAFHDFVDTNGDGFVDLFSPVSSLGLLTFARIFLARKAEVQFIVHLNSKGKFQKEEIELTSFAIPVDFRGLTSLTAHLPLLETNLLPKGKDGKGAEEITFVRQGKGLDVQYLQNGQLSDQEWHISLPEFEKIQLLDLNSDGRSEAVIMRRSKSGRVDLMSYLFPE
jgi:hypothetical protein